MQNWEVKHTILKIKKTKTEIRKELEDSIINGRISSEDTIKVIQDFEQIIHNKNSDIVGLGYYQGQKFQKFRQKERFLSDMVSKFKVSKSKIVFKIVLRKLIDDYSKIKNSSLSLHYFKKHLKLIKEVCKENANKFE